MRAVLAALAACASTTAPPPPLQGTSAPPPPRSAALTCAQPGHGVAVGQPKLRAATLIDGAMVAALPGGPTTMRVGVLEGASLDYDDIHFQAMNKPESADVALRVYTGPDACTSHIELHNAFPAAKPVGELGDAAFLAEEDFTYGVAIYERRGVGLIVLCGKLACPAAGDAIRLARQVHARLPRSL